MLAYAAIFWRKMSNAAIFYGKVLHKTGEGCFIIKERGSDSLNRTGGLR